MARTIKEWIGNTDDSFPTRACRLRMFDRACGHCQQCGAKIGLKQWEADHIVRLKDGGENRESNLQVLCIPCHRSKTGEENTFDGIGDGTIDGLIRELEGDVTLYRRVNSSQAQEIKRLKGIVRQLKAEIQRLRHG